jgi:hypothetical protein
MTNPREGCVEITKIWLTISTKPINAAAREGLPIVEASVDTGLLSEAKLIELIHEAMKRLDGKNA